MPDYIITTYDWVPEVPRGYVRDLRIRWALEEAGFAYEVHSTPFENRSDEHFARQPFGQVPWLTHGDTSIFESGAILLYLAQRSEKLMPADAAGRNRVTEWLFAALNSVEMASLPWTLYQFSGDTSDTPGRSMLEGFLASRLQHMNWILNETKWLAENFSAADILMADVLRLVDRFDGLADYAACQDYIGRATARPGFEKAFKDQLRYFQDAD